MRRISEQKARRARPVPCSEQVCAYPPAPLCQRLEPAAALAVPIAARPFAMRGGWGSVAGQGFQFAPCWFVLDGLLRVVFWCGFASDFDGLKAKGKT